MQALRGITVLLVLQSLGELASRGLQLPLPGPVVGMLLLLLALRAPWVQQCVGAVAEFLLAHLSLLFVPVGVGVMTHLGLIGQYGVRIGVVLVVSTWISLAVTAWVLRALVRNQDRTPP
jgi:holin-like protein